MGEFLIIASVIVLVGGGLASIMALALARMAVSGPVSWFRFGSMQVVVRPALILIGVSAPQGSLWADTGSSSRIYERVERRNGGTFRVDEEGPQTGSSADIRLVA